MPSINLHLANTGTSNRMSQVSAKGKAKLWCLGKSDAEKQKEKMNYS